MSSEFLTPHLSFGDNMPEMLKWSNEEKDFLRLIYPEMGATGFNIKFKKRSYSAILTKAYRLGVRRNKRGGKLPLPFNKNFDSSSYAYNYLLGVTCGDGHARKDCNAIVLIVTDKDFRDEFIKQGIILGFNPKSFFVNKDGNRKKIFGARIHHKLLVERVHSDIRDLKITVGFLNGFIDSESNVGFYNKYKTNSNMNRSLAIYNSDEEILLKIKTFLLEKGIESHFYKKNRIKKYCKPEFILMIFGKNNLINFHNFFHYSIKRKQDRFDAMVKSYMVN